MAKLKLCHEYLGKTAFSSLNYFLKHLFENHQTTEFMQSRLKLFEL